MSTANRKSGRRGRPVESYTPKDGPRVEGLSRCNDGRWRVHLPDGRRVRFTEPDEARAVARAKAMLGTERPVVMVPVTVHDDTPGDTASERAINAAQPTSIEMTFEPGEPTEIQAGHNEVDFWEAVRREVLRDPARAASLTGLPGLASPGQPSAAAVAGSPGALRLSVIIEKYRIHNPSLDKAKNEATKPLRRLIEHAHAKTLTDLTTEKLLAFRDHIEHDPRLKSAATRRAYYGRIRGIIAFGLKVGLDSVQIRAALDRCRVLWTAAPMPVVRPRPISREHFHTLLDTAGTGPWRAWLLVGLNLCLHIEEVCGLRWEDLDLQNGTHAAIREKTRRRRIPRAAVLWPETIAELRKLPHKGPYVFTSTHGTRYNKNTRVNDFREFRRGADLPDTITFDTLRDGAYTCAFQNAPDERQAKVLAGHAAGLADNYVLRHPRFVAPACEAVYREYGPFPSPPAEPVRPAQNGASPPSTGQTAGQVNGPG